MLLELTVAFHYHEHATDIVELSRGYLGRSLVFQHLHNSNHRKSHSVVMQDGYIRKADASASTIDFAHHTFTRSPCRNVKAFADSLFDIPNCTESPFSTVSEAPKYLAIRIEVQPSSSPNQNLSRSPGQPSSTKKRRTAAQVSSCDYLSASSESVSWVCGGMSAQWTALHPSKLYRHRRLIVVSKPFAKIEISSRCGIVKDSSPRIVFDIRPKSYQFLDQSLTVVDSKIHRKDR